MTAEQFRDLYADRLNKKKPRIRNAKPKRIDGIYFPSTMEAQRYQQLKFLKAQGAIKDFELQPEFKVVIKRKYRADFRVIHNDGSEVIEDVKGHETEKFKENKKALLSQYPEINFRVIKEL